MGARCRRRPYPSPRGSSGKGDTCPPHPIPSGGSLRGLGPCRIVRSRAAETRHRCTTRLKDPLRLAADAFQRACAIDSATAGVFSRGERPPELIHLVEIAQVDGDSATVGRLARAAPVADSTNAEGWYLRWHRALALGDSARRAFWSFRLRVALPHGVRAAHRLAATTGSSIPRTTPWWVPSGSSRPATMPMVPVPGA